MKNELRYLIEDLLDIPPVVVVLMVFCLICGSMAVLSLLNGLFPSGPWHVLF